MESIRLSISLWSHRAPEIHPCSMFPRTQNVKTYCNRGICAQKLFDPRILLGKPEPMSLNHDLGFLRVGNRFLKRTRNGDYEEALRLDRNGDDLTEDCEESNGGGNILILARRQRRAIDDLIHLRLDDRSPVYLNHSANAWTSSK